MDFDDLLESDVDVVVPPTAMAGEVSASSAASAPTAEPEEPPEPEREPVVAVIASSAPAAMMKAPAVGIPGTMLTAEGVAAIGDLDKLALADLLSPSKLTEYLTKTVGEHQAVIDVDAAPGMAIKAMMRQALLLVLANQKILGKTDSRATQLETVISGSLARQDAMVKTLEPALRAVLKGVLEDADELVVDLIKGHLSAGIDATDVVAQRKETEELKGRLATAEAVAIGHREEMSRVQQSHEREIARSDQVADDRFELARRGARKFALMACAFTAVSAGIVVALAGHLLR